MKKNKITIITTIAFLLASCGAPPSNNNYIVPQQISEPQVAETTPTFETQVERVNNCDGANPTYNVSYKTVETQKATFEVAVSAGGLVTGTPLPPALEVQLEAKITAALAKDFGLTTEKNHEITLENPQGTFLEHTIEWKVTRVKGLIEVIYGDGVAQVIFDKIANVELHNRTSQSLSCDSAIILPTKSNIEITPVATLETQPPATQEKKQVEHVTLPRQVSEQLPSISTWTQNLDIWSNAESVKIEGGCAELWRDLTWNNGPRDSLTVCNEQKNLDEGWAYQVKEVEVDCASNNSVTVTLWADPNFSGGYWQQTFCSN